MVVLALSIMLQRVVLFDDPLDVVPYICVSGVSDSSFPQITLLKFTVETLASSGAGRAAFTEEQRTLPSEGIILLRPLYTEVIPREPKLTSFLFLMNAMIHTPHFRRESLCTSVQGD